MSAYGVIFDSFWDGVTGQAIRESGGRSGQLCAAYLLKNRQDNMIGLYALSLSVMKTAIGTLSAREIERGMVACGRAAFADYDTVTGYVWVRELAKFRLNLNGNPLSKDDNRVKGAARLYKNAQPNPFLAPFYRKYHKLLPLLEARSYRGACKPLAVGKKPVNNNQRSDQKIDQVDQEQCANAHDVLVKIAHTVLDATPSTWPDSQIREDMKVIAAKAHIPYDAEMISAALDSAAKVRRMVPA